MPGGKWEGKWGSCIRGGPNSVFSQTRFSTCICEWCKLHSEKLVCRKTCRYKPRMMVHLELYLHKSGLLSPAEHRSPQGKVHTHKRGQTACQPVPFVASRECTKANQNAQDLIHQKQQGREGDLTHLVPFTTGQPPCRACLSNVPFGCME